MERSRSLSPLPATVAPCSRRDVATSTSSRATTSAAHRTRGWATAERVNASGSRDSAAPDGAASPSAANRPSPRPRRQLLVPTQLHLQLHRWLKHQRCARSSSSTPEASSSTGPHRLDACAGGPSVDVRGLPNSYPSLALFVQVPGYRINLKSNRQPGATPRHPPHI